MSLLPDTRIGKIEFYHTHAPVWRDAADEIGVTVAQVDALAAKVAAARAALLAQQEAMLAARAATAAYNLAVADLHRDGMTLVAAIRTTAAQAAATEGPGAGVEVYVAAQVPPPAARRPLPPPGRPREVRATLLPTGTLRLTWKCTNPHGATGTMYEIRRRDGAHAPLLHVATVGVKHFVDESPPAGVGTVTYSIRAIRSTNAGPEELLLVNLGVRPLRVAQSA